jgi:hypothetical protein
MNLLLLLVSGTDSTSGGQLNLTITITRSNPRYHHPDHVCPYYLLLQTWSPRSETKDRKHISPNPNTINVYQSASISLKEPLKDEFVFLNIIRLYIQTQYSLVPMPILLILSKHTLWQTPNWILVLLH